MRYPIFLGMIIFLATSVLAQPVRAEAGFIPETFARPLMQWVAQKMHIRTPRLPNLIVSRERMVAYIGNPQRQAAMARALYVPGTIVVDEEFWDETDTRTVSFLVHEMVHHAQMFNGKRYRCNNAKEWEAYRLQNQWLAEHGLPPAVSEEWISQMAECNNNIAALR